MLPFHTTACSLCAKENSVIVGLIAETGEWVLDSSTSIVRDLLEINRDPCFVFLRSDPDPREIASEAEKLCFKTRTLQVIDSLQAFLESRGVRGDAVHSSALADWYGLQFKELKKVSPSLYLFDPSILLSRLVRNLVFTLAEINKFDVSKTNVLIPLVFVWSWAQNLKSLLQADESILVEFAYES